MPTPHSVLSEGWDRIALFLAANADTLGPLAELVKIVGALASFFALWKLRTIEKRYLFRATIPGLIDNIDVSLQCLAQGLNDPDTSKVLINQALYRLLADANSVVRRAGPLSTPAANELLRNMRLAGISRRFWQRPVGVVLDDDMLFGIYGSGAGLLRSLENELKDSSWSAK